MIKSKRKIKYIKIFVITFLAVLYCFAFYTSIQTQALDRETKSSFRAADAPRQKLGLKREQGDFFYYTLNQKTGIIEKIKNRQMTINQKNYYFDENGKGVQLSSEPLGSMEDGFYLTKENFILQVKDHVASINGIIIVNKTFSLPAEYGEGLTAETKDAFFALQEAAAKESLYFVNISGYRSYYDQDYIFNNNLVRAGEDWVLSYSAKAGHSEHQLGQAIDANSLFLDFGETAEGKWLSQHCWKYGFILRYPEDKTEFTGFGYEPWHIRYVGKDLAETLYHQGEWLSMEEYFGLPSEYDLLEEETEK